MSVLPPILEILEDHALVVDGALTAGMWTHPELGAGFVDSVRAMFGVDEDQEFDMVYPERS